MSVCTLVQCTEVECVVGHKAFHYCSKIKIKTLRDTYYCCNNQFLKYFLPDRNIDTGIQVAIKKKIVPSYELIQKYRVEKSRLHQYSKRAHMV